MSFNVYVRFGMSYFVFGKVCGLCYVLFGIILLDFVVLGVKHHTIKAFILLGLSCFWLFVALFLFVYQFVCLCN